MTYRLHLLFEVDGNKGEASAEFENEPNLDKLVESVGDLYVAVKYGLCCGRKQFLTFKEWCDDCKRRDGRLEYKNLYS